MRSEFYMVIGLPGSGREELAASLREGSDPGDVVLTVSGLTAADRMEILRSLPDAGEYEKICVICAAPFERCRERSGAVPDAEMKAAYLSWETPHPREGWDQIRICYTEGSRGALGRPEDFVRRHMDFAQENSYHQETLGVHLQGVHDCLLEQDDPLLIAAGLIHDCGKPYTKSFTDWEGNETAEAHYDHHENAGSYDALFFRHDGLTDEEILKVSFMVGMHMQPHLWQTDEERERCRADFGDAFYEKLMLFKKADDTAKVTDLELGNYD